MKFKELSKMQKEDLDKKLHELHTELMKLNAQVAIGTTPKSTKQIREIKRTIARFQTLRMQQFHDSLNKIEQESNSDSAKHAMQTKHGGASKRKYKNL